ncbi:MAG TPA: hypothetical protein VMX36_13310 [Sedimentisphaerales bacterium]|nr:hypothetical protein [Sedimentisphaerales bacterium]
MDWLKKALKKVEKSFGRKDKSKSKQKCPIAETGLLVAVVRTDNRRVVKEAIVDIQGKTLFNKKTDDDGLALFKPLEPDTYKIEVTLPDSLDDTFIKPQEKTQAVTMGNCPICVMHVDRCARPRIKLQWQETKKPVGGVGITIPGTNHDFGETTPADGKAQLQSDQPGILPGTYTLHFNLKSKDLVNAEVIDANKPIKLPSGCRETFTYELRKSWVEFVINDQFNTLVSDMEYTLTFPDGKTVKHGNLANGKIREEGPPGQYKLALKFIYFTAWEYSPLKVGEPVKLVAQLNGYDKDTDVVFEIYDACGLSKAPLDTVSTKVTDSETVEAPWTPVPAKLEKAASGSLVLIVRVGKCRAISNTATITEKQTFEIKQDNKPVNTQLVLHFTDGYEKDPKTAEGKAEVLVPFGRDLLWIDMPDMPGERVSLDAGGVKREFAMPGEQKA